MLYNKVPDTNHLLSFGNLVAVHQERGGKLQPRARVGLYVGYSDHHSSDVIKIFMPDTKRIVHAINYRVLQYDERDGMPTLHRWRIIVNDHTNRWPLVKVDTNGNRSWSVDVRPGQLPIILPSREHSAHLQHGGGGEENVTVDDAQNNTNRAGDRKSAHHYESESTGLDPLTHDDRKSAHPYESESTGLDPMNRKQAQALVEKYKDAKVMLHDDTFGKVVDATRDQHGEWIMKVEHDDGIIECTEDELQEAIEVGETHGATEWVEVPRDGITVKELAEEVFHVDPETYEEFISTFEFPMAGKSNKMATPNLRTRFNKGTQVPVPMNNKFFMSLRATATEGDMPSMREALHQDNPERDHWLVAIREHYEGLVDLGTFEFVDSSSLSESQARSIKDGKWVLVKKRNADGEVTRYKARWVGKGFTQKEGIDFHADQVSAPVCRMSGLRHIIARAVLNGERLTQVDIANAYLNAEMDTIVHMRLPEGFEQTGDNGKPRVARVRKCVFGFRQSGRLWNNVLDEHLTELEFKRSKSDPCVYTRTTRKGKAHDQVTLALWTDDLLISCKIDDVRNAFVKELGRRFELKDFGECNSLLGMKVEDTGTGQKRRIKLSMPGFVKELLARTGMTDANTVKTPAEPGQRLSRSDPSACHARINGVEYRSCCGAMLWMSLTCMPHLAYSVNALCKHVNAPTEAAVRAMKRLLRYVAKDPHRGVIYAADGNNSLRTYSDSDWGDCIDTGRSTTGFCVMLAGGAISWSSKLQPTA